MAEPVDALISGVSGATRADSNSVIRTIWIEKLVGVETSFYYLSCLILCYPKYRYF